MKVKYHAPRMGENIFRNRCKEGDFVLDIRADSCFYTVTLRLRDKCQAAIRTDTTTKTMIQLSRGQSLSGSVPAQGSPGSPLAWAKVVNTFRNNNTNIPNPAFNFISIVLMSILQKYPFIP